MNQHEGIIMEREGWVPASFDHPKNIKVGKGRVLWAAAAKGTSGIHHPEGWVLPGGIRTRDEVQASAVAAAIDYLSQAAS